WPQRPRRRIPVCSVTSCHCSGRGQVSMCGSWRRAPARRSIPAAAATPMSCSSTRKRRRKSSSRKDLRSGVTPSCTTTSFWSASNAYVLADRGTWLSFKNRGDLVIAVEGDKRLFNQYGVMLVNPQKHPAVKQQSGQQFIDWLVSPEGQKAIADYKIDGEQLFYP